MDARAAGSDPDALSAGSDPDALSARSDAGAASARTDPDAPSAATDPDAAGQPAPVELELEYHVPGAGWVPVYQLRLDGRSGAGTLVLRACVAQRTGEDWSGVRLGLSTADLLRRADLPELRSLRIGRRQEAPADLSWREPPAGLADLFTGYDAAVAPKAPAPLPPLPAPMVGGGYGSAADMHAAVGGVPEPGAAPVARSAPAAPSRRRAVPYASLSAPAPAGPAQDVSAKFGGAQGDVPDAAPPAPGADLLDYARLALAGPDAPEGRGTLRPASPAAHPIAVEYRRRAESVAALPGRRTPWTSGPPPGPSTTASTPPPRWTSPPTGAGTPCR